VVEKIGLLVDFGRLDGTSNVEIDGMRTDVTGALYVTRATRNEVVKLSPNGELLARIELTINTPRNLELGGADGKTLFVVGPCSLSSDSSIIVGCVDKVTVPDPGRAWSELQ
jgi:sugar lactone lactonase YvrE